MEVDIEAALDCWARWSRRVLSELGWASANIIARIVRYGLLGAAQQVQIRLTEVDKVAEFVERGIMSRLSERDREIVCRHYLLPEPDYISAEQMGIAKSTFSERLGEAKAKILAYLQEEMRDYAA